MKISLIVLCTLFVFSLTARASTEIMGSIAGNASDLITRPYAVSGGKEPIHWCVEYDEAFGVGEDTLVGAIKAAFKQWRGYVLQKGVDDEETKARGIPTLSLNDHYQERCDDLSIVRFYAGKESPAVTRERGRHNDPLSFSRIFFNETTKRHEAYIWIKNSLHGKHAVDLGYEPFLKGLLLHEMGHALVGCDHVAGTIMQANLGEIMLKTPQADEVPDSPVDKQGFLAKVMAESGAVRFTHIDYYRELYFSAASGITLYEYLVDEQAAKPDEAMTEKETKERSYYHQVARFYERVIGKKPRGAIYQKFYQFKGQDRAKRVKASLFMTDAESVKRILNRAYAKHLDPSTRSVDGIIYADPDMHRFDFVFDFPDEGDVREIEKDNVFRRVFGALKSEFFPVTSTRRSSSAFARVFGETKLLGMKVTYIRNVDRYTELNKWNKDLVTLSELDENGRPRTFFRGLFDEQARHVDGFFEAPGGQTYEEVSRFLGKPANPDESWRPAAKKLK